MEPELVAFGTLVQIALFIRTFFATVGLPIRNPIDCFIDNEAAEFFVANGHMTDRNRHLHARHLAAHTHHKLGHITVQPIRSADNKADMNTKLHGPKKHAALAAHFEHKIPDHRHTGVQDTA